MGPDAYSAGMWIGSRRENIGSPPSILGSEADLMKLACENMNVALIHGRCWRIKELSAGQWERVTKRRPWAMNS